MDMIAQNVADDGRADISFTVRPRRTARTRSRRSKRRSRNWAAEGYDCDDEVSKISIVGLGMATQPGVADRMFRALAEKGINILMITTSEIKISVLVAREFALEALRTVHARVPARPGARGRRPARPEPRPTASSDANDVVARMEKMEQLIIEDVSLDESQARVTVVGLPDIPGLAAQVFDEIAEAGMVVDMIVQSVGRQGHANISFTVPAEGLGEVPRGDHASRRKRSAARRRRLSRRSPSFRSSAWA